jgi:voltage-gated sodium channel
MYGDKFEFFIVAVILVNATALAVLTFRGISPDLQSLLLVIERVALWIYVVELGLRILSYGTKPWLFFKSGWNIFDFIVIGSTPFFQGQAVVLRLLRLFRIIRIFRFLPEVRILTRSVIKSVPPLASFSVLIAFLLFLYAMTGHYLFGAEAPENWGDVGASMQSLFILLTLENFPDYFTEAMAITPLALLFFLSYVFVIVFTVLNVLIGIVLNAMDQARDEDTARTRELKAVGELEAELEELDSGDADVAGELTRLRAEISNLRERISRRR